MMIKKTSFVVLFSILSGCSPLLDAEKNADFFADEFSPTLKEENTNTHYDSLTKQLSKVLALSWDAVLTYQEYTESNTLAELTKDMQSIGFFLMDVAQSIIKTGREAKNQWTVDKYKKTLEQILIHDLEVTQEIDKSLDTLSSFRRLSLEEKKKVIKDYVRALVAIAEKNLNTPNKAKI